MNIGQQIAEDIKWANETANQITEDAKMLHTVNQLKDHCDGLGAIVFRLKQAKDEGEAYETIGHLIDSLGQQWKEINHEAHLETIIKAAGESCCNAEDLAKDNMFFVEQAV